MRAEPDNEEWLLVMKAQRHEGMRRYQASLTLNEGEPTRRYCFKLLWADSQQWFGPQGWSPTPPGQLAQFAVDEPDHGPEWVADQLFYQIFPIGSPAAAANTASRAAATAITRPVPR